MYKYLDDRVDQLEKDIKKRFNRSKATLKFDELNVLNNTKALYKDLEKLNKDCYLDIAEYYYNNSYKTANLDKEKLKRKIDLMWLAPILSAYDPVTKYVYDHEVERKRARLTEALISTHTKNDNYKVAYGYWKRQSMQYAITVADKSLLTGYDDLGVTKVRWKTENDSKVCPVCRGRNNKIYAIDKIPTKPHYLCRCYFEVVK